MKAIIYFVRSVMKKSIDSGVTCVLGQNQTFSTSATCGKFINIPEV